MERVQLMSENSTSNKSNDGSNLLKGILLLTLGVVLGVSASAAVYKIQVLSSQPENLSRLPRNRSIRTLKSSETDEVPPLLQICRSQLASTKKKLTEEKDACEASKASLKDEQEAMTSKLQKEKNACEASKESLNEEKDRTSLAQKKEIDTCLEKNKKLEKENWIYFKPTNSYYYYRALDYCGWKIKYNWQEAEDQCVEKGAHLASVHSDAERDFLKNLILSNVKALNKEAKAENPCGPDFYAWIGLHLVNGTRKWSDGTADDFLGMTVDSNVLSAFWMMYNDIPIEISLYSFEENLIDSSNNAAEMFDKNFLKSSRKLLTCCDGRYQ